MTRGARRGTGAAGDAGRNDAIRVRVAGVRGSAPREVGAEMIVTANAVTGSIGGGALEYMAMDRARAMLAKGEREATMDVPLGPEIGQCCGGRTRLSVTRLDADGWTALRARAERERRALPQVLVFGAGHVGRALAEALALLPLRTTLIDSRPAEMRLAPSGVDALLTPLPEAAVREAPAGSAFVVLTHDHALDFLIAREALARGDAAYVGMIGSRTKLAQFRRFLRDDEDGAPDTGALVCPIGAAGRPDKRPEVIAAFVAAEILARTATRPAQTPAIQQGSTT